jgi:hypothetical protein
MSACSLDDSSNNLDSNKKLESGGCNFSDSTIIKIDPEQYPDKIRVKGLPFIFTGWNNIFVRTNELINGYPIYYLKSSTILKIYSTKIIFVKNFNGRWYIFRDEEYICLENNADIVSILSCSDELFGKWSNGVVLEKFCSRRKINMTKSLLFGAGFGLGTFITIMFKCNISLSYRYNIALGHLMNLSIR